MATQPLMPKATAIWLVENTSLTFDQIADFCQLHILEVESIADGENSSMAGFDPIVSSQLTLEEIKRCEASPQLRLTICPVIDVEALIKTNRAKYTPLSKRKDKPNAVLWLLRYYAQLSDMQICKLLGTTRSMVQAVRSKTHWNYANMKPHSPVSLGFCSQEEFDLLVGKSS